MLIKKKHIVFILLVCITLSSFVKGQGRVQFNQIGITDGLSNGSIKSIYQDRDGFIWIGTLAGLNQYDGAEFKVYNASRYDNNSISADDITSIIEDSKGRMWVGTFGGGVCMYNKELDNFITYSNNINQPNSLSSNEVHIIYEDSKGNIWIGTEAGLNKFNETENNFTIYTHQPENPSSLSNNSIRALYEDSTGTMWVGTFGGGMNKFDINSGICKYYKQNTSKPNSISSNFISDIEPYGSNQLLIATNGGGVNVFNFNTGEFTDFFHSLYDEVQIVRDITIDSQGIIWIGTDGDGLFKITPDNSGNIQKIKIARFMYSNQIKSNLGSNAIYKIFEDNQQNIWIGTAWNGISIIEHSKSNIEFIYSDIEGIEPSPVLSMYADKSGNLWIGSDGKGLYFYDKSTGKIINYSTELNNRLEGNYIQLIKEDKAGNIWIGTYANGLTLFNRKQNKFTTYRHDPFNENSISHNNVRTMLEDEAGNFWVATWGGGISYFNTKTGTFKNYLHNESNPASISNNNALAIVPAANDKLWIGTFGGGLNLFEPETGSFTHFSYDENNTNSISGNNILCLHKDNYENLWIGTWGNGLTKFNVVKQEFTRFDLDNGLPNNTITSIEEDDEGILWISTKKGIFSLDPKTNNIKPLNLGRNSKINEFHINSSFKDINDRIYFGGLEGLIAFYPDKLSSENSHYNVKLTGFQLFNKDVPIQENSVLTKQIGYSKKIDLKYDQSVFTIEFTALDFPFSDNCVYAIKMEGFEENWREIGTERSATFTNLSPGEYTFLVRAKGFNSDWNNDVTSISIEIHPPIYKTWWAMLLYIIIFIGLLFAFQRYTFAWARLKNNLKVEKINREQEAQIHQLKLRFFTNISHEIRTPLTLILDPLNKMLESGLGGVQVQNKLQIIKKNADRLLQLINELLDFRRMEMGKIKINVAEGNIVKFTHEIFLSFTEHAHNRNISYTFRAPDNKIMLMYDRQQLEKVIYNLLSNAFKFTPENGSISVSIEKQDNLVYIAVSDSGAGIPESQLPYIFERFYQNDESSSMKESGFGIGLTIAKELVELHSGSIEVSSKEKQGSTFTIILKQGEEHLAKEIISRDYKNSENIENYTLEPTPVIETIPIKEAPKNDFSGNTLLIVEDNTDLRKYLADNLSDKYKVLEAANGKEGIEIAKRSLPDLIISDIMMPIMDGMELCRNLKTDVHTSHIPIILLTARTAMIYKVEGFETGADEYITKPFSDKELRTRIKNLLNNRKLLRERYLKEAMLQPKDIVLTSPDEKFLNKLIEIIEKNMEEPEFKVELLTKEIGMSHSVIYKKIKALTGQSLIEFVRDIRLKRAAQLLKQKVLSVTEICYKVGFTDRRYFSQAFKKKFGQTPSEFANE
ncbi:MAG: response regulator [Bacteroidales bacterium]|nr:response regulator [Bacteroidales bacterium]